MAQKEARSRVLAFWLVKKGHVRMKRDHSRPSWKRKINTWGQRWVEGGESGVRAESGGCVKKKSRSFPESKKGRGRGLLPSIKKRKAHPGGHPEDGGHKVSSLKIAWCLP